jgi:hypothetical protein
MFRFLILIFFINISFSCIAQKNNDFPFWLVGTWEIDSPSGTSYEEWKLSENGDLLGRTYRLFGNDTLVFDNMRIYNLDTIPVFEMFANNQNTRELTKFYLQIIDEDLWKFENINSYNPRSINYHKIEENLVYVWTEHSNTETACMDFLMKKK